MASRSHQNSYDDFFVSTKSIKQKNYRASDEKAAWSPSWIESPPASRRHQQPGHLFTERTEGTALHTELPGNTGGTTSIPNFLAKSNYRSSRSAPDDYPFFFSDPPVDCGSVQTGISQQELLRKKARKSKQTRYTNSNTKKRKNKPVVQITWFLSSRTTSRNSYSTSSNLSSNPSKLLNEKPQSSMSADVMAARWKTMKRERSDEIELSTAETTLTDSSSRHRSKDHSSPLRVVLNDGDLMLTARQRKIDTGFSDLDIADDDFPLLSRSSSEAFEIDFFTIHSEREQFSDKAHQYDPPSIARHRVFNHDTRNGHSSNYYDSVYEDLADPTSGRSHLTGGESKQSFLSESSQGTYPIKHCSLEERLWYSEKREEPNMENKKNRLVRFSADVIMPALFDSHQGSRERQNCDQKPKPILREPRYHIKSPGVLPSSSPFRFSISKPLTPEKIVQRAMKSPRSVSSPSFVAGVLDENGPLFSPTLKDISRGGAIQKQPYERFPDPPLDSVNIDDDDTTYASRIDDFLETIAAIVIQAAIRRLLAVQRYLGMVKEHKAIDIHDEIERVDRNEQQTNSREKLEDTPDMPILKTLSSEERLKAETSPLRSFSSFYHIDRDDRLQENLHRKISDDTFNLAAIRIQATFRGFWARDSLDVDHFCAVLIQSCVRRYLCEKKYLYGYYHVVRYAVRIQSLFRGALTRQNLHRSIGAAILIQAYARGFIKRKAIREIKSKALKNKLLTRHYNTGKSSKPKQSGIGSWQEGLATYSWKARQVGVSDNEERTLSRRSSVSDSQAHEADMVKSSREEHMRSSNSLNIREKNIGSGAARELFPSRRFVEGVDKETLPQRYHRSGKSRMILHGGASSIWDLAAIKIQSRYRAHTGERKLIRSLVDILIVQTVMRRWLAIKRANRLRILRNHLHATSEERKDSGTKKVNQSSTLNRLTRRTEFFQTPGKVAGHTKCLDIHPHVDPMSELGPPFDEDGLYQPEKVAAARVSTDHSQLERSRTNTGTVAGLTPSTLRRTKAQEVTTSDNQTLTQPPQWTNMMLRPTRKNIILQGANQGESLHQRPRQRVTNVESESRVNSIPLYLSEADSSMSTTHRRSERRQVVVTPPVLLKRNTDRQVARPQR